ncbi:MAG: phosphoenolpyruvate synthase [Patescibacteria group bacterium]|nr:phosphoenolpyruvate synthase [Patescibacteria group bacterium]
MNKNFIKNLKSVGIEDVVEVGGKNASLGEMLKHLVPKGVNVPGGFVVTASAYKYFLEETGLKNFIKETLKGLNTKNLSDLAHRGKTVRERIEMGEFPEDLKNNIIKSYRALEKEYYKNVDVAVRSSATAEDLPGASFAGEHETYLNITGADEVLKAVKSAMASLFTNRAISYRADKGFDHFKIALSVGVQKMVRSDTGCSGVIFSLDTESGFKDMVLINGAWGLGEMIVQGEVTPDEFLVFKPKLKELFKKKSIFNLRKLNPIIDKKMGGKSQKMTYSHGTGIKNTKIIDTTEKERESWILNDKEILQLANWAVLIEDHYSKKRDKWTPMDIEWAKDGKTKKLFIVQARPETIHAERDFSKVKEYILKEKGKAISKGTSVGNKIVTGKARVIMDAKNIKQFKTGEILVTDMTDPDWEPIMKIASAIVTDKGGRTSHAAIVSRELGIPCVVGTENATNKIETGKTITVDTTGAEGIIYEGALKFNTIEHNIKKLPKPKTKIMMNIATPDTAFEKSFLPNDGVGLAREEFIIASNIGIHPNVLINYEKIKLAIKNPRTHNPKIERILHEIDKKTVGHKNRIDFYVDKLAYGIAKIAAAFYPKPIILRFSDFKTNEYRTLLGGELYEPQEENPMIGWRGASRYYHPDFKDAFILELKAVKKVREEMGLDNVQVMVPFCRTPEEGKKVVEIIEKFGLRKNNKIFRQARDDKNLKIFVMCEIPSNVILADRFLDIFDGMSIGSNDLTQLTVGIDRDGNEKIKEITNEKDESVKNLITEVIKKCRTRKKYIGICGQASSDYPDFAEFLVEAGIGSISLNPDTVVKTTLVIAKKEKKLNK